MMMAGGALEHNGIFSDPNLHNQQSHMEADSPDSRKRPLEETPTEEAGCTKRTNTGGRRASVLCGPCTSSFIHPFLSTQQHNITSVLERE